MLNARKLGLAGGILWGLFILLFTWIAVFTEFRHGLLPAATTTHQFYAYGLLGGLIGGVIGFVEGFIFFFLLGWLYNKL